MSQTISSTDCLDNLVSLRGACTDEVPTSGLWINDLGVDMDFIGQVITKDYSSPTDFFNKKVSFAAKVVANEIHNFLSPKYKANTVVENLRIGHFGDSLKIISGSAGKLKGIEIDLCQGDSYLDVYLNEIALQVDTTGTVSVLVYDLLQNKLLDTIDVDTVANEIAKVYVNKTYKSDRKRANLFIGYLSTGIGSNTTRLKKNCTTCGGRYLTESSTAYSKIKAAEIDASGQIIKENLEYLTETGGLSIVHSLSCNHENWLCSISNQLGFPILYKTAYLIYDHGMTSKNQRQNNTVNLNAEQITERRSEMEALYNVAMGNLLRNIKPPSDEACFACRENLRHIITLP